MNQVRAESAMPSSARVERRMRTDELDEVLETQSDSVTVRRPVSVEWPVLKPV